MTSIDITNREINPLGLRPGDKLNFGHGDGNRTIGKIVDHYWAGVVAQYDDGLSTSYALNAILNEGYEVEFEPEIGDVYKLVGEAYDDYNVRNFEVTVTEVQNGTVLFTALQGHGGGSQPVLGHGPTRVIRLLPQTPVQPEVEEVAPETPVEPEVEEVIKIADLKHRDKVTLSNGQVYELDADLEIELSSRRYLDEFDLDALGLTVTSVEVYVEPKPEDTLPTADGEYANPNGLPGYRRIYRRYRGNWSVLSQNFVLLTPERLTTGAEAREQAIKAFNDVTEEFRPVLLSTNN